MKRDTLNTLATLVITACAVAITGVVVHDRLYGRRTGGPALTTTPVPDWQILAATGHRTGPQMAQVTITEFSDFQCPYCAVARGMLHDLQGRYGAQVALVYRHFPLEAIHSSARKAAISSECADEQGRFLPMHDALFAQQAQLGLKEWSTFAREAGVRDSAAFAACMASPGPAGRVDADVAAGRKLNIPGTPTLIINNLLVRGALDSARLDRLIRKALDQ